MKGKDERITLNFYTLMELGNSSGELRKWKKKILLWFTELLGVH